jgi:hypothetical protein
MNLYNAISYINYIYLSLIQFNLHLNKCICVELGYVLRSTKCIFHYMEDNMTILHNTGKGAHMNTLEKFHIHETSKQGVHLNDTFTGITNPIFETLIQADRRKRIFP